MTFALCVSTSSTSCPKQFVIHFKAHHSRRSAVLHAFPRQALPLLLHRCQSVEAACFCLEAAWTLPFCCYISVLKKLEILTHRDRDCAPLSFGLALGRLGQAAYSGTDRMDGRRRMETKSSSSAVYRCLVQLCAVASNL